MVALVFILCPFAPPIRAVRAASARELRGVQLLLAVVQLLFVLRDQLAAPAKAQHIVLVSGVTGGVEVAPVEDCGRVEPDPGVNVALA